MQEQVKMNKYYIIGFEDNADGEAYAQGKIWTADILNLAIEKALHLLTFNDHVCIGLLSAISGKIEINTLTALAPSSLILSAGDDFPLNEIVNKL